MGALYNEIDPYAAQWLRNLIAAGHIADGAVDERRVETLDAADVAGPGQRHFFAGIAGWGLALRIAGVPDDANIWTGSCPCQPFSDAGRGTGFDDERHLWPAWFRLIRECRPRLVFGEQVASTAGLAWLDAVHADLEGAGYTVRAADLCAASVGAPHRRQRLFFVAYADGQQGRLLATQRQPGRADAQAERGGEASRVADTDGRGRDRGAGHIPSRGEQPDAPRGSEARCVGDADEDAGRRPTGGVSCSEGGAGRALRRGNHRSRAAGADGSALAHTARDGRSEGIDGGEVRAERGAGSVDGSRSGISGSAWSDCDWVPCSDGVSRPVEPGTHPLASGIPARVGKLRAYGNAIVPQVAAVFIRAALEAG